MLQPLLICLSLLVLSSSACVSNDSTTTSNKQEKPSSVAAATTTAKAEEENKAETSVDSLPDRPLPAVEETTETEGALQASLRRTACYGRCPVYTIRLYDTGLATYEGKRFVDKIGMYQAMVGKEVITLLRKKAEEVGYFQFAGVYPRSGPQLVDLPACETYLKDRDGTEHSILNKNDAPKGLIEYEQYFDSLFAETVWLKQE